MEIRYSQTTILSEGKTYTKSDLTQLRLKEIRDSWHIGWSKQHGCRKKS